jgi:hypothetical protein
LPAKWNQVETRGMGVVGRGRWLRKRNAQGASGPWADAVSSNEGGAAGQADGGVTDREE